MKTLKKLIYMQFKPNRLVYRGNPDKPTAPIQAELPLPSGSENWDQAQKDNYKYVSELQLFLKPYFDDTSAENAEIRTAAKGFRDELDTLEKPESYLTKERQLKYLEKILSTLINARAERMKANIESTVNDLFSDMLDPKHTQLDGEERELIEGLRENAIKETLGLVDTAADDLKKIPIEGDRFSAVASAIGKLDLATHKPLQEAVNDRLGSRYYRAEAIFNSAISIESKAPASFVVKKAADIERILNALPPGKEKKAAIDKMNAVTEIATNRLAFIKDESQGSRARVLSEFLDSIDAIVTPAGFLVEQSSKMPRPVTQALTDFYKEQNSIDPVNTIQMFTGISKRFVDDTLSEMTQQRTSLKVTGGTALLTESGFIVGYIKAGAKVSLASAEIHRVKDGEKNVDYALVNVFDGPKLVQGLIPLTSIENKTPRSYEEQVEETFRENENEIDGNDKQFKTELSEYKRLIKPEDQGNPEVQQAFSEIEAIQRKNVDEARQFLTDWKKNSLGAPAKKLTPEKSRELDGQIDKILSRTEDISARIRKIVARDKDASISTVNRDKERAFDTLKNLAKQALRHPDVGLRKTVLKEIDEAQNKIPAMAVNLTNIINRFDTADADIRNKQRGVLLCQFRDDLTNILDTIGSNFGAYPAPTGRPRPVYEQAMALYGVTEKSELARAFEASPPPTAEDSTLQPGTIHKIKFETTKVAEADNTSPADRQAEEEISNLITDTGITVMHLREGEPIVLISPKVIRVTLGKDITVDYVRVRVGDAKDGIEGLIRRDSFEGKTPPEARPKNA